MIDEHEHVEYFVKRRISDPGYTAKEALGDYLYSRPDVAADLAFYDCCSDDAPFSDEALEMYIKSLSSCDAF